MKPGTPFKLALAAVVVAALGSVAAVIAIGASLGETAVPDASHEHGLRYDRDRAVAAARGLRAAFAPASLVPGGTSLDFALLDQSGAPVAGAAVTVALHRPAGGGEPPRGAAVPLGAGRYRAPVGFATPGFWDVRLDVTVGGERIGLVQQVRVEAQAAAPGPCDLAAGPCSVEAGGLVVTLDLGRALQTTRELPIAVEVRRGGAPLEGAAVEVAFAMKDMNMGENRVVLQPAGPGRWAGKGVLVRCHSGKLDWIASVTVRPPGAAPASAGFPFKVRE